jgi:hypothetical protein
MIVNTISKEMGEVTKNEHPNWLKKLIIYPLFTGDFNFIYIYNIYINIRCKYVNFIVALNPYY